MTLQTVTEKVVIRMLNAVALIYGDLPVERPGEPAEFRAVLDLAIGIIRARAAHRAAAETLADLKLVAGDGRPRKKKGPASGATLSGLSSANPVERISA